MSQYSDVFGGELGYMEGKVHLGTEPNVAPTVMRTKLCTCCVQRETEELIS